MPKPKPTYADFAAVISYGGSFSFSPDGTEIAMSSNADGHYNLWIQPVDGDPARQLTEFTDRAVRQIDWSPDGNKILFTADRGGNEKHQLHVFDLETGGMEAITDKPEVQYFLAAGGAWSPDAQYILFAGNDRVETAQDVIVRELPTEEDERPLADGNIYEPVAWSPDGEKATAVQALSNTNTVVYVSDIQSNASRSVLGAEDESVYGPGPWSADGTGFWVISDRDREFHGLAFYSLEDSAFEWVEQPDWDVETVSASTDGRFLAWSVNDNGRSQIFVRNLQSGLLVELPEISQGVLRSDLVFAPDGKTIAFLLESATASAELLLLDLQGNALKQLTNSRRKELTDVALVEPELVSFAAFDGRNIAAWVYKPVGDGPFPAVLSIHGGPEAQERPAYAYRGFYQYLLSQGIGVLAPNIRGSSGYGKSYQKLIHRDLGGNDVKDFESCVKYLQNVPWVDPKRIAVFGGSYGGFAVLTCVSRLPDYWAAAVDIVGPSNLVTMLRSFPPTWKEVAKETFGDVDTEEADLLRRSPITYVDQIKTPLFIIQGANDPRVVKAESDQIVEKLRNRGVEVKYDVYEDEGHGFTKKENELKGLGDSAAFLVSLLNA